MDGVKRSLGSFSIQVVKPRRGFLFIYFNIYTAGKIKEVNCSSGILISTHFAKTKERFVP